MCMNLHDEKERNRLEKNKHWNYVDGLVQERRNSIANALELRLSCTNLLICSTTCKFSYADLAVVGAI